MRRRKQHLQDLDQDIRDHIELETRENIERGMAPEEARQAALRRFGNVALVREDTRAVWTTVWLEQLLQDLRYAFRALRHNPVFTVVVILTLALAIGMNTAVFGVLNAVLLRPLSYPNAERLLWVTTYEKQWNEELVSDWDFLNWREQAQSLEGLASYHAIDLRIPTAQDVIRARFAWVSEDFWKISGVRPVLGRLPLPGEQNVLVLSSGLFERWFQSDSTVIGKAVELGERQHTVIGVLPKEFLFEFPPPTLPGLDPVAVAAYRPALPYGRGRGMTNVVGRLKPGFSVESARAELAGIRARVGAQNPRREANEMELRVLPLLERRVGHTRAGLWILFAAVAFVLLIACANIANLLLARASARRKEIAIRASIGAGRLRVLRQFLVESSLLVFPGAIAGLFLARWAIAVLVTLNAQALPRLAETTIDVRVLWFALGASILTAFLFGLVPLISLRRTNLDNVLKDAARAASANAGGLRARQALVAVQLAFTVVLVTGAGLMVKSFWRMHAHPPGFTPERILVLKIQASGPQYFGAAARQQAYIDEVVRRVRSVPGVQATSVLGRGEGTIAWEGASPPSGPPSSEEPPLTVGNGTTPELAGVLGLPIVRGRWFNDGEKAIVINESLAHRDFGSQDPIGKRMEGWGEVVGVVGNLKYSRLDATPEPEFYVPYSASGRGELEGTNVVVRTAADPMAVAPTLRKLVSEIDKTQPALEMKTLEQALADSIAPRRFNLFLFGTFAAAALLLAVIGIYGVTAYSVAQRTHEIGIRMALGAQRRRVVRMVLRQGLKTALAGIALGLAAALALTRLMASLLYDVQPGDPRTFVAVAAGLVVTTLAACWLPALKAALVDPIIALRHE